MMLSGNLSYSREDSTMKFMMSVFCRMMGVLEVYMILMRWEMPSLLSLRVSETEVYQPSS